MKLLFTGVISLWLVALLFVGCGIFSIAVYRKQRLPKPWSFWLPAARVAAIGLLLLTLLQPVIARIRTIKIRGSIPVLVDTSGSMSVVDMYSEARQIDIAWRMGLFPPELRNTVFLEDREDWALLKEHLAGTENVAGRISSETELFWSKDLEQDLREFLEGLDDLAARIGVAIDFATRSVNATVYLGGSLVRPRDKGKLAWRRYDGIGGNEIQLLKADPKYPDKPEFEGFLTGFHAPVSEDRDNYGGVARGYVIPPVTGEYEFFLCSDDEGELLLSTDSNPVNKRRIAHVPMWTMPNEWNKYPSQKSGKIDLEAHRAYYVEAIFKEGGGRDHLTVGWLRPDGRDERPIPGDCLALAAGQPGDEKFNAAYGVLLSQLSNAHATAERLRKSVGEALRKQEVAALAERVAEFQGCAAACRAAIGDLTRLQELADERFVAAEIDEVEHALGRLSKMTRSDLVRFMLLEKPCRLIDRLERRGDVDVFSFDENPEALIPPGYSGLDGRLPATRLGSTMHSVLKRYERKPVSAMVILSDGNSNAGKPVQAVKKAMLERDIPVIAVGVGSAVPPPDIAIARVSAPRTSFLDDRLNVSVMLQRYGVLDRVITLKAFRSGVLRKENVIEAGGETTVVVDMSFVETEGGMAQYEVQAEVFEGEAFEANNTERFSVNILEDRIRALLIDEFPRWESRYANMMLRRDRRVDLKTIFVGSCRNGRLPAGPEGYPQSREELFAYDILIVGDVNPAHFSEQQMGDVHDFVAERGGALVALAGEHYMPAWYSGTPLEGILPLRRFGMGATFAAGIEARGQQDIAQTHTANNGSTEKSYVLEVADGLRYDDLLQIGDTTETSRELWENLPSVNWANEGVYVSRVADLLVTAVPVHHGDRTEAVPILAKTYAGLGKVLYLGTDSFWRWRYKARWTYHHRLWGQILLWATTGRTAGADRYVKLMTDRSVYAPEEAITIKARILDETRTPISNADASIEIFTAEGELVRSIPLTSVDRSGGEYRAQVRDLARGRYRIIPRVQELADKSIFAEVEFEVRDLPTREYIDLALDEAQLRDLSEKYVPLERARDIVEEVPQTEIREEQREDAEIWDTWLFMLLVAGLLAFEWQMRKKHRLA